MRRTLLPLGLTRALGLAVTIGGLAAFAAVTGGQGSEVPIKDLLVRFGGPVHVAAGDSAWAIAVVDDDAVIEGRVQEGLLVINGTARITGTVDGSVAVVNGHVEMGPGARIGRDLVLYGSTVSRASGATVGGQTLAETGFSFGRRFLLLAWLGITVALTAAAALFAAIGGGLLDRAATALRQAPGAAIVAAVIAFVGLPLVAFLLFLTVLGSALGFGIVAVLLPALWVLGYLVAGTWFGRLLLPLLRAGEPPDRPYAAATLGIIAAQVVGLIPVVGGIVVLGAGTLGAGVLASLAWNGWRHHSMPTLAPAA